MTDPIAALPRLFIASSSEQIAVAQAIAAGLGAQGGLEVKVWDQLFEFSAAYIESLEAELDRADFAVAVLTGDDAANVRSKATVLPRDNVLFELGLFIGRLGRARCFFFVDAASGTQIASDLSGVKAAAYHPESNPPDPRRPTLAQVAAQVAQQIRTFGATAVRHKPQAADRAAQEALWRLCGRLAGLWWERMQAGDDDSSALSLLRIDIDPVTLMPRLEGRAFGLDLKPLARWVSVASAVVPGERPKVHYRWEGEHDDSIGQLYGGHGLIHFTDASLAHAEGYFFDTNFAHVREGALTRVKRFRLARCSAEEVGVMQQSSSAAAQKLMGRKLKELR